MQNHLILQYQICFALNRDYQCSPKSIYTFFIPICSLVLKMILQILFEFWSSIILLYSRSCMVLVRIRVSQVRLSFIRHSTTYPPLLSGTWHLYIWLKYRFLTLHGQFPMFLQLDSLNHLTEINCSVFATHKVIWDI